MSEESYNYAQEISYNIPDNIPARKLNGAKPVFTAFGCALLERQTEKAHIYSALNLSTQKVAVLSRRAKPLDVTKQVEMAKKIRFCEVAESSRFCVDQPPGKNLTIDKLSSIMREVFYNILPQYGYAVRGNQIDLSRHILETICRRGISLSESAVGTGKTHAYLVAAILTKRGRLTDFWLRGHYPEHSFVESAYMPIVISTSSIALQNAIARDYIPELSKILMAHGIINAPLTCSVRKGKEHYICEERLQAFYKGTDKDTRAQLSPLIKKNGSCDISSVDGLSTFSRRRICVSGSCSHSCPSYKTCRYQKYMRRANDPHLDIVITNHNLYLADIRHRTTGKRPLLPHYQMVIVDEAHKFLDTARQMYGSSLNLEAIHSLTESIHRFTDIKSAEDINLHRCAKKLDLQGEKLFHHLFESLQDSQDDETERLPAVMDDTVTQYFESMKTIAAVIKNSIQKIPVHERHRNLRAGVLRDLDALLLNLSTLQDKENNIYWLEQADDSKKHRLSTTPKNLDTQLSNDIWSKGLPMILTSGTLSASGDFSRAKQSLGLKRIVPYRMLEISMDSPFDYKNNTMLYVSASVPFPDQQDRRYISAVANEVERLILASYGHAAVLFTSYKVMEQVFLRLSKRELPYPLFQMGRKDTNALDKFKASSNGILFAAGALWEGIDIPGDTLSMLIIVKLPFSAPDPIGDYEKGLFSDMGAYKEKVLIPDMLIKLKQGFGRLIRTETDTGVCAVLDSRAKPGAAYHNKVVDVLPGCHITQSVEVVEQFFKQKKSEDYLGGII